eukprot:gene8788-6324_t
MPYVKYDWPVIGGRTIPELIAMVAIVGGLTAAGIAGGAGLSGDLVEYVAFAMVFFIIRSNFVLSGLLNISYERGLLYHKAIGTGMMALVLIHAIGEGMNSTGIVLGVTMLGAPLVYAFEYFLGKFNLFYYPHITLSVATIPVAFLHGAPLLGIALIIWLADLVIRHFIMGKRVNAQASMLGDDCICLDIDTKDSWRYEAGQYCFLMVPGVNSFEYHPFTIASSSPKTSSNANGKTTFLIKVNGDWTAKLVKLVKEGSTHGSMVLPVIIDGAYGVLSVDLFNAQTYEHVVLVSGGVGVTPMTALLMELLSQTQQDGGSKSRREIHWIWSVRDAPLAEYVLEHVVSAQFAKLGFTLAAVEGNTEEDKVAVYVRNSAVITHNEAQDVVVVEEGRHSTGIAMTSTVSSAASAYAKVSPVEQKAAGSGVFVTEKVHLRVHYSAKEKPQTSYLHNTKGVFHGKRPDFETIFQQIAGQASASGGSHRVGVAVCGPAPMVSTVRDLCDGSVGCCGKGFGKGVMFDCHEEIFRF